MELNNKIRKKKDLSGLAILKSFVCVCVCVWKVVGHFSNFQVFFADQCSQTIGNCRWPTVIYNAGVEHHLVSTEC